MGRDDKGHHAAVFQQSERAFDEDGEEIYFAGAGGFEAAAQGNQLCFAQAATFNEGWISGDAIALAVEVGHRGERVGVAQINVDITLQTAAEKGQHAQREFRDGERFFVDINAGDFVHQRIFGGEFRRDAVFNAAGECAAECFKQKHTGSTGGIDDAAGADM